MATSAAVTDRKRPVNLTLSEGLVEQARNYTDNLSATVEELLADYVSGQEQGARHRGVVRRRTLHALMAQFDVHRNQGPLRDPIPFVVVVQSSQFDAYRRRVVVPLVRSKMVPGNVTALRSRMNPAFRVRNIDVVLHPLDMVSVALNQLGPKVGSLADHGQAITDALDELLTRTWG
jgi:toxin CcdB